MRAKFSGTDTLDYELRIGRTRMRDTLDSLTNDVAFDQSNYQGICDVTFRITRPAENVTMRSESSNLIRLAFIRW